MRKPAALFSAAGTLLMAAALLMYPQAAGAGIASSVSYCLGTLVPSLFPFMALCSYAVNSPAASALGRPLGPLTRRIFRLPGCCALPIFMSFIGGYPAGAKGASLLLQSGRITSEQAGRMLMFCVNPGLAFTVTFLGIGVFHSAKVGWLLFLSVTLPAVLMGIIAGLKASVPPAGDRASQAPSPGGALTRSVTDAAKSVLVMCACIVLFSGFTALLHACGLYQWLVRSLSSLGLMPPQGWAAALSFLLEVTGGTGDAQALGVGPGFFAFGLAFGGICVHLQVFALFGELPLKTPVFLLCRLTHGLLSAGCFAITSRLLPQPLAEGPVPVWAGVYRPALSGGWMGGASLLLMCAAFLLIASGKDSKYA